MPAPEDGTVGLSLDGPLAAVGRQVRAGAAIYVTELPPPADRRRGPRHAVAVGHLRLLEGAQAGLSWITILKKRDAYRRAFSDFEIARVARFRPAKVERLLANPGIIRNRLKIESAILNAKLTLAVQKEFGSLDAYLWGFVGGATIHNHWESWKHVPATSAESDTMSKDMKKRGFKFIGSTICYALMQAIGMVNDHETGCFRYRQINPSESRR